MFFLSLVTLHPDIRGDWWLLPPAEDGDDPVGAEVQAAMDEMRSIAPVFMVGITIVFAAIYGFLVWATGKGHNWARWLLLAFVLATTALGALDYGRSFTETPLAFTADLFFSAAEVWAFWLLFFSAGAAWFKAGT